MGLKVYRLWVMGQLDSTCRAPPWPHMGFKHCPVSESQTYQYKLHSRKSNFENQDIT
jgi:hypothetical protein